jgi:cytochrome c
MNIYFAALLVALITMKLGSIISDSVMHVEPLEKPAYIVSGVVVEKTLASEIPEKIEDIVPLMAKANAENGKKIAGRCTQCHGFDKGDPHKLGPNLWAVIGAQPGAKEGYSYSDGMKAKKEPWSAQTMNTYLANPRKAVPGTKMSFAGISNIQERADLIAFLSTLK